LVLDPQGVNANYGFLTIKMHIFIATTPQDLRLCRICIASVRRFHPQVPIQLLPGAPLPPAFLREVQHHYQVGVLPLPGGHYGWGFVKLEPLFLPAGQTFLILDADTALTGPVLDDLNARLSAPRPLDLNFIALHRIS